MRLYFLGPGGALDRFPSVSELRLLGNSAEQSHMDVFLSEAWKARQRMWIWDLHFYEQGYIGLKQVLARARIPDVRILSGKTSEKRTCLRELQRLSSGAWRQGRPSVETDASQSVIEWHDSLLRKSFPFAHDRFVVLDDNLWHFGYAACGSGRVLSAASGPWPALETNAISFFEEVWMLSWSSNP